MQLVTPMQVFVTGLAGGLLLELLHWYALRRERRMPAYAKSALYWIVSGLMAVAGGAMALIYFGSRADAVLALHVGLSTPLILQKLTTTAAKTPGGKGKGDTTVISFFEW